MSQFVNDDLNLNGKSVADGFQDSPSIISGQPAKKAEQDDPSQSLSKEVEAMKSNEEADKKEKAEWPDRFGDNHKVGTDESLKGEQSDYHEVPGNQPDVLPE